MPPKVQMIPIKKDEDAFYRYKMPRIAPRKLSSGNGVKTAILNASDVCRAISRTQTCITQWFSYSLAVLARINNDSNQIHLNGDHDARKLQASLYEFIDNFVLCPSCTNPETTMDKRGNTLVLRCSACGQTSPVNTAKTAYIQRTADWILSHLVTEQTNVQNAPARMYKGRIDAIDEFARSASNQEATGQGVSMDIEELEAIQKKLEANNSSSTPTVSREELITFSSSLAARLASDESDHAIYEDVQRICRLGGVNISTRVNMVVSSLFNGHIHDFLDIIRRRRGVLIRLAMEENGDKEILNILAGIIEETSGKDDLISSAPVIFHCLFENEIVDVAALQNWYEHPSRRFEKKPARSKEIREYLKVFFNWLTTAEFEDVEEYDESDEEAQNQPQDDKAKDTKDAPVEDDLDIDNI